jgi:hypothetical protein
MATEGGVAKPLHKHDCKQCVFLGSLEHEYTLSSAAPCDLYICSSCHPDKGAFLRARYSPREAFTRSASSPTLIPELVVARDRARARELLE